MSVTVLYINIIYICNVIYIIKMYYTSTHFQLAGLFSPIFYKKQVDWAARIDL